MLEKPKRRRTPQQKKKDALTKDRHYHHGLNSKQRRKSMPEFNKTETRTKRSAAKNRIRKQILDDVDVVADEGVDLRRSWKPNATPVGVSLLRKTAHKEEKRLKNLRKKNVGCRARS